MGVVLVTYTLDGCTHGLVLLMQRRPNTHNVFAFCQLRSDTRSCYCSNAASGPRLQVLFETEARANNAPSSCCH